MMTWSHLRIINFRSIQHISLPGCFEIKDKEVGKIKKDKNTPAAGQVFHTIRFINDLKNQIFI